MGTICGAGVGVDALWEAARSGTSAVTNIEIERPGKNAIKAAAQLKGFEPAKYIEAAVIPFCDRFSQFALVAADEALSQAQIFPDRPLGERCAIIIGTGIGGYTSIDDMFYAYITGQGRLNPMTIPRAMCNAAPLRLPRFLPESRFILGARKALCARSFKQERKETRFYRPYRRFPNSWTNIRVLIRHGVWQR